MIIHNNDFAYPTTVNVYPTIVFVTFNSCQCFIPNWRCIASQQSMFKQQSILYRI